jgi:hypothetical protein
MRQSDYPLPSYAFSCWYARGNFYISRPGKGTFYFPDSPDGLNELRMALLTASDATAPLGFGRLTSGAGPGSPERSNLEAGRARVSLTVKGKAKLSEWDLWGDQ